MIVDIASSWKLQKQLFLKNEHSKLLKGLENKEKAGFFSLLFELVIPAGLEPALPPWEGDVLDR